jgi:hypothetical protein
MDELTRYIFNWCPNLLTDEERKARKHFIGLQKIKNAESEAMKCALKKVWLSTNANILELIKNGESEFYKNAVKRVLRNNPDKEFMNLCPKCKALARTPKAKQCPKCFYSWHKIEQVKNES